MTFVLLIELNAQVDLSADIYSRYIWRGQDFGNSLSVQPSVSLEYSNFSAGLWGAYSIASSSAQYSESDFWLSYSFSTEMGDLGIIYTDYFFPDAGLDYFNYKNNGLGGHALEAGILYSGVKAFPLRVGFYYNFYNDTDKSAYLELGYPIELNQVSLSFFTGASLSKSAVYSASKGAIINAGFSVSKSIKVTDSFNLPLSASFIVNPHLEKTYFIIGVTL